MAIILSNEKMWKKVAMVQFGNVSAVFLVGGEEHDEETRYLNSSSDEGEKFYTKSSYF